MDEDQRTVLSCLFEDFLVASFVRDLIPLDGLLPRNANELLLGPAWSVRYIETGPSTRQHGGMSPRTNPNRPCNDILQYRASLVVEKMDLVDGNKAYKVLLLRAMTSHFSGAVMIIRA